MERKNTKDKDFIQTIIKPLLMIGYAFMVFFGLMYYFVYALIVKILKKENKYTNTSGFIQNIKSIVFSDTIKEHTDLHRQRSRVKKSRKQSAEYFSRPKGRLYTDYREGTRDKYSKAEKEKDKKNYFFKRLLAYAGIFFLKEDIRKAKAIEIDQKYPPRVKKEERVKIRHKSQAVHAEKDYSGSRKMVRTDIIKAEDAEAIAKRSLLHKRIMIGSASVIMACVVVFVGALAYAQELPASLNIISSNPTADLFQTMEPVTEESVCEVIPESDQGLYLEYPDDTEEESQVSMEIASNEAKTIASTEQDVLVSGNITTEAKIYKQGDEDPEVANIQARLMELHYMKQDDTTNYYGKNTTYAMEYFQRQHGLQVDGTTGAETLAKLYSDEAEEYTIKEGVEGSDVKEIQERLYELKYLSSSSYITGYFGSKTEAAVEDFQHTNSLSADGVVGYYTNKKLFSSSAIKNSTSSGGSSGGSSSGGSSSGGATGSGSASDIVNVAKSLRNQGYVYVWGGKNPSDGGFDCSGFVYYVLNQAGIKTGYRDTSRWATTSDFTTIEDIDDVKAGDVLVFSSGHVGIYIGGGKMIHSTSRNSSDPGGIYVDNLFTDYRKSVWVWAKRIVD